MYEVQKYLALTEHGYLGYAVIVNKKFWEGLPGDVRGQLEAAMKDATVYANKIAKEDNDKDLESVKKTGRCVIVHEATHTSGFGAELAALVQQHCFFHLEAPIARVIGWDTPYPHAQEWDYFPGPARLGKAMIETMEA